VRKGLIILMIWLIVGSVFAGPFVWGSWVLPSVILALISVSLMILVYFVSKLLDYPKLAATAKDEIVQILFTFLLIGIIYGVYSYINTIPVKNYMFGYDRMCDGHDCLLMEGAESYLTDLAWYNLRSLMYLSLVSTVVNDLANLKLGFSILAGAEVKPFDILNMLDSVTENSQSVLIGISLLSYAYLGLLEFGRIGMMGVILPLGFMLRCFSPTRSLGGALIGLTLTFTIMYPLVIVINDVAVDDSLKNLDVTGLTENLLDVLSESVDILLTNPKEDLGIGVLDKIFIIMVVIVMKFVTPVVVASLILPIIDFAILSTVARAFTRALGQQIDISNLTRMI